MILGFMQKFPWSTEKNPAPTNFREKILSPYYEDQPNPIIWHPKLHTFREDPYNRWRAGMSIQMVYRGPKYSILDHFNKDIPELSKCVSTQKIEIKWSMNKNFFNKKEVRVLIDNYLILECAFSGSFIGASHHYRHVSGIVSVSSLTSDLIAVNDGFSGLHDFFRWFNKDWSGKIIHWTDLRY